MLWMELYSILTVSETAWHLQYKEEQTSHICRWTKSTKSFFYLLLSLAKPVLYACSVCLGYKLPNLRNWTQTHVLKSIFCRRKKRQKAEGRQICLCFGINLYLYPVWEREPCWKWGGCQVHRSLTHLFWSTLLEGWPQKPFSREPVPHAKETGGRAEFRCGKWKSGQRRGEEKKARRLPEMGARKHESTVRRNCRQELEEESG